MTYPSPFVKMTVGGAILSEDIWTNGLSFFDPAMIGQPTLFSQIEPEDFIAAVNAFYATATTSMNSYNTIEYIKLAYIGEDGKYLADAKIYDYPTPRVGTSSYTVSPQDTVVLSELTASRRGLAHRGRIYMPAGFAQPEAATGRLSTSSVTAILAKGKAYFEAINTILEAATPSASIVVASSVGAGAFQHVSSLEVGNLMDNQSRRRNRLQEVYVDTPIVF